MKDTFTFRDKCVIQLHKAGSVFSSKPCLPYGVSFLVVVKDKAKFIRQSVLSVLPFADEIVIVDGSLNKETFSAIKDLVNDRNVFYFKCLNSYSNRKFGGFVDSLNLGLSHCKWRWVFKWDGDMVADFYGFSVWMKRLSRLNPKFFYEIDVGRINTDLRLGFGGFEGRLFTQHPRLKYKWVPDRDCMVYPCWVRLLRWNERYITHLDPK